MCRGRFQETNAKVSILLAESESYMRKNCTIFEGERLCLSSRVGRQTGRQATSLAQVASGREACSGSSKANSILCCLCSGLPGLWNST